MLLDNFVHFLVNWVAIRRLREITKSNTVDPIGNYDINRRRVTSSVSLADLKGDILGQNSWTYF